MFVSTFGSIVGSHYICSFGSIVGRLQICSFSTTADPLCVSQGGLLSIHALGIQIRPVSNRTLQPFHLLTRQQFW
jgi:hypothetical protein